MPAIMWALSALAASPPLLRCTSPTGLVFVSATPDGPMFGATEVPVIAASAVGFEAKIPSEHDWFTAEAHALLGATMQRAQAPIVGIDYRSMVGLVNALSERDGLAPVMRISRAGRPSLRRGVGYRLPTSKEWLTLVEAIEGPTAHLTCDRGNIMDASLVPYLTEWGAAEVNDECSDGSPFLADVKSVAAWDGLLGNASEATLDVRIEPAKRGRPAWRGYLTCGPDWANGAAGDVIECFQSDQDLSGDGQGLRLVLDAEGAAGFDCDAVGNE